MSVAFFPLVRITLLGSGGCGKTSLINAYVNNFHSISPPPGHTHWPTLFYKVERLKEEEDSNSESPLKSVCVELEDTYDADRTDEGRDIRGMLDMKRKTITLPRGVDDFTPFNIWKPPLVPTCPSDKYHPVTHGRMGFLIVFDVNKPNTFNRIMQLYDDLKEFADFRNPMLKPVIFLVANKMDVDPTSESVQRLISQAELYAQQMTVRLWKVSAANGKNVKRMFRDMLYLILANSMLWDLDYEEESESEEEREACLIM